MAKHGKKYMAALAKVDLNKEYSSREAVALAKETQITKFDSTVEVHMRTALDPRQADQQVRDVVVLPNGLGKTVRVLVFAQGEGAAAARSAGADLVADDDETLKKIEAVCWILMSPSPLLMRWARLADWAVYLVHADLCRTPRPVPLLVQMIYLAPSKRRKRDALSSVSIRQPISMFQLAKLHSAPISSLKTLAH